MASAVPKSDQRILAFRPRGKFFFPGDPKTSLRGERVSKGREPVGAIRHLRPGSTGEMSRKVNQSKKIQKQPKVPICDMYHYPHGCILILTSFSRCALPLSTATGGWQKRSAGCIRLSPPLYANRDSWCAGQEHIASDRGCFSASGCGKGEAVPGTKLRVSEYVNSLRRRTQEEASWM
jgi:hypothetical protein